MWTGSMLATVNSIVGQFVPGHYGTYALISQVIAFILAIGFGGHQANVIQFGLDQLQDALTIEITAFIMWYVWMFFSKWCFFLFHPYVYKIQILHFWTINHLH